MKYPRQIIAKIVIVLLAGDQLTRSLNLEKISAKKVKIIIPSIPKPTGKPGGK